MSYILDALRRADSERERGQVPGLNAQPASLPAAATPARGLAPALWLGLGMLLLAGLAGLAWWVWPLGAARAPGAGAMPQAGRATAPAASVAPPAVPRPAPPPLPVVVSAPPPAPVPAAPAEMSQVPEVPTPVSAAPSAGREPPPMALAELTAQQRRDWPVLSLGGAVYSDNPASRFIIVDGQLVHEGEEAAPGVTVERIGPRAAILRRGELRVELPW